MTDRLSERLNQERATPLVLHSTQTEVLTSVQDPIDPVFQVMVLASVPLMKAQVRRASEFTIVDRSFGDSHRAVIEKVHSTCEFSLFNNQNITILTTDER